MERRDFVGAMLAVFCGTALPEPIIECLKLIQPITFVKVPGEITWTDDIDKMLKEVYCQPILDQVVTSQRVYNRLVDSMLGNVELNHQPRYVETAHYFELPPGWKAVDEGRALTVE